ncbi:FecR domain-containing protein [Achromobacter seleniivolatilans]|uniref:FecR domain-containing protein n=1 Tax=Achromobacter seleniivolatilans TaxID=3047478 RepID=A0ABY9M0V7_9BURK|nr:FecR domain-containing protein [Achromobacter sp. R39]WMD20365.1 FecR domain-containing protein [Achromobacter sp. R39]
MEGAKLLRPHSPEAGRIDPKVIRQAADWWARLREDSTDADRRRFETWRLARPEHDLAWQRLGALTRDVALGVAEAGSSVAGHTLRQAPLIQSRRNAMRWMVAAAGLGLGAWAVGERGAIRRLTADLRTATGERRALTLPDGTLLELNTGSAVDLRYTGHQRELVLLEGEILVTTGQDRQGRPFTVRTRSGVVTPVGTRFLVRDLDEGRRMRVAVLEGAVDVRGLDPADAPRRVPAGGQAEFSAGGGFIAGPLEPATSAWLNGMLIANEMPLSEFLYELGRYRPGRIGCSSAAGKLRVVGAFPLADSDKVLAMLQEVLPVSVRRYTRYWVSVGLA